MLEALAAKAKEGNKSAYADLLAQVTKMAHAYCIKHILSENDRDDCVQEILLSVHRALPTYEAGKPFKPWFYAICNFRVKDYLRQHYRKQEDTVDEEKWQTFTQDVTNPTEHHEDITKLLSPLKEKQKQILILSKVEGYTSTEVAHKLGMTASAVKVSLHRTLKQLQGKLK